MKRRRFIGTCGAALVPAMVPVTTWADGESPPSMPLSSTRISSRVFYDRRFPLAQSLARSMFGAETPTAVWGDITPVWRNSLAASRLESGVLLAGVTTETFYFCLDRLLPRSLSRRHAVQRLDRNLHAWSIAIIDHPTHRKT